MNILQILKIAGSVLKFFSDHKDDLKKFVTDAETIYAEAGQGPSKLGYVIAAAYGLAEDVGAEFAKVPADLALPFLSGRIGQIVAKLFPKGTSAKAATA